MSDPISSRPSGTAPLPQLNNLPGGNGNTPPAGGATPPEGGTPPAGGNPPATAPQARDGATLSGRPGTSRLSLPGTGNLPANGGQPANGGPPANGGQPASGPLQAVSDAGQAGVAGARGLQAFAETAQAVSESTQAVTDVTSGVVDTIGGTTDAASGLKELGRGGKIAEKITGVIGEGTTGGKAIGYGGGALGIAGSGAQIVGGAGKLMDNDTSNDTEGKLDIAQGVARVGEGGGMIFATAAANSTRFGAAATTVGGKVVPALGAISGTVQVANSLMKDPPDIKSATTGAMTAVGSVAMAFPPVGTAVGGALVVTAAVIDNWETISNTGKAVGGAIADAGAAVGNAVGNAASKVASWFGW